MIFNKTNNKWERNKLHSIIQNMLINENGGNKVRFNSNMTSQQKPDGTSSSLVANFSGVIVGYSMGMVVFLLCCSLSFQVVLALLLGWFLDLLETLSLFFAFSELSLLPLSCLFAKSLEDFFLWSRTLLACLVGLGTGAWLAWTGLTSGVSISCHA